MNKQYLFVTKVSNIFKEELNLIPGLAWLLILSGLFYFHQFSLAINFEMQIYRSTDPEENAIGLKETKYTVYK